MDARTGGDLFLFEGFRLDRQARALCRRGGAGEFVPIAVGSRAFEVLDVLVGRAGDLVSRDEFMAAVWPATAVEDINLNVQIAALRRVLDEGRAEGSCIQTIPGRGYRFAVPVTRLELSDRLVSGRPSGNGAGDPIAEPPENPSAPSLPGKRPPIVPRRERKRLSCGSLGLVAGALCLLAVVVTASNWRLPQPGITGPAPRLSVVVLPFTDLSDNADQRQFASRITEDLTADLSLMSDMRVTSRNTAFTYGNKLVDTRGIGREVNVRYVLEGSVQRSGNQVRVNAQLVDAETDSNLWAKRFDGDTSDVLALQDEITRQIATALEGELIAVEAARPTQNPDALDYILRGRAVMFKPRTADTLREAINLFEHALLLDPKSIWAQTQLVSQLTGRVLDNWTDTAAADISRAEELAGQALAAFPRTYLAHYAKAQVLRAQRRYAEATPEYEAALASNRNHVFSLYALGQCKLFDGSIEEVVPLVEQAIRFSRYSSITGLYYQQIGIAHLLRSRTAEAITWLEKARNGVPTHSSIRAYLASAYALNGETEHAYDELTEARRLSSDDRYSSLARLKAVIGYWGVPRVRALFESTYFAGLSKAGMPEE